MEDKHYIVEVDFGDNALTEARHIRGEAELAAYLARVPHMIGFQIQHIAQINISHVVPQGTPTPLPGNWPVRKETPNAQA